MNIVIDTNVILSALYSKKGASFKLLKWLFRYNQQVNVVSIPLITEFEDVLTRPEHRDRYHQLTIQDINLFIDDICNVSKHQKIFYLWRPFLSDVKDDMVLETAFNGNADYIVTHNIKDFRNVYESFSIQPVTPKLFLEIISELLLATKGELK